LTRFSGSESYVAPPELALAVNAAITLGRPLLAGLDRAMRSLQ
jgi:hypothetical protein